MTKEELSDKCWDIIKVMTSSYQQPGQESEEEEDSVMAALMKSTDEEYKQTANLSEMS